MDAEAITTTCKNRRRRLRRFGSLALGAAIAGGALVALDASPASASTTWTLRYLDADRFADVAFWDSNRNGYAEQAWLDLDNDGRWDSHFVNTPGTSEWAFEAVFVDLDEDGAPEIVVVDVDGDRCEDWYLVDSNEDGWIDHRQQNMCIGPGPLASYVGMNYSGFIELQNYFARAYGYVR